MILRKSRRPIPKVRRLRPSRLSRKDVTRAEFNRVIEILNQRIELINTLRRDVDIQFKRTAQLQADIDDVRRAWMKVKRSGNGD